MVVKSGRDHPSKNGHVRRRCGLALKRSPPRAPILPGYQANTTNRDRLNILNNEDVCKREEEAQEWHTCGSVDRDLGVFND